MLDKAREFSVNAHGEQKYGDKPYSFHLDAVVNLLEPYGDDAKVIGYLHDVLEDENVDIRTIESEFGPFISKCVSILTDEPSKNRKERKRKTYAKLAEIKGKEELALVVCVADRLANIQACVAGGDAKMSKKLLKMYKSEQLDFYNSVHRDGLCDDLWSKIESALGN